MDVTTVPRLKERIEGLRGTANTQDLPLLRLITAYSARAERYLNRHFTSQARTETVDVQHAQIDFSVKGAPITSITDLRNDSERTFGTDTIVNSTDYTHEPDSGIITVDRSALFIGTRTLQINYVGGMATTTVNFISFYPDLTEAIEMQIMETFQERRNYGLATLAVQGTSLTFQTPGKWLPEVRQVLDMYRFHAVVA